MSAGLLPALLRSTVNVRYVVESIRLFRPSSRAAFDLLMIIRVTILKSIPKMLEVIHSLHYCNYWS